MQRRDILKAALCAALCPVCLPGPNARASATFLRGFNAYYLHEELYRRAEALQFKNLREAARDYLFKELALPDLVARCSFNAVRFWAFNHYPCEAKVGPSSKACTALASGEPNRPSLDVMAALLDGLEELGLALAPVLSNYWLSYGGVLAMLEWAGELPPGTYEKAFCGLSKTGADELLHEHSLAFYSGDAPREAYRRAVRPVLEILAGRKGLAVVELMNEPRGLFPQGGDARAARSAVASWLAWQGSFARSILHDGVRLSSGEEGWLAKGVPDLPEALKPGGEPWEGVDMLDNVRNGGMDVASVHCYLHPGAAKSFENICGIWHEDVRGWDFLMKDPSARPDILAAAGEGWIAARGAACGQIPWYLGEFGWTRPGPDREPLVGEAIREERARVYASWMESARKAGAFGAFVWMPDGPDHKDTFYGLDREDLIRCFAS
jgi:hypothetical protein